MRSSWCVGFERMADHPAARIVQTSPVVARCEDCGRTWPEPPDLPPVVGRVSDLIAAGKLGEITTEDRTRYEAIYGPGAVDRAVARLDVAKAWIAEHGRPTGQK